MLKGTILQAVVFEQTLILFSHSESLQNSFILQFKRSFRCSILHLAQSLHVKFRVIDKTATATNRFVIQISVAFITLVINLNELNLCNKTKYFDYMSYYLISRYSLYQLNCVVSLEVSHLIFDLTNDSEVIYVENELNVDINLI